VDLKVCVNVEFTRFYGVPTFAFSNVNKEKLILLLQVFNTVSFFDFLHWRSSHSQSIINYSLLAALPTVRVLIVRPQT